MIRTLLIACLALDGSRMASAVSTGFEDLCDSVSRSCASIAATNLTRMLFAHAICLGVPVS